MTLDLHQAAPALAAAMSGGISIDFDKTLVVQMVVFSALIVILKPLLFDPVLRIFEEREKRTDGARADARRMQEEAGELLRRYETELERVGRVAAAEREQLRTETAKLEAEILHQAREVTQKIVREGRQQIQGEVTAIRGELARAGDQMARDLASRVLGREVGR